MTTTMEGNGGDDVLFGDQIAAPTGNARESALRAARRRAGP